MVKQVPETVKYLCLIMMIYLMGASLLVRMGTPENRSLVVMGLLALLAFLLGIEGVGEEE